MVKQQFCGDLGTFHEGLAVKEENGKYFHITEDGEPAYPERYDMAEYFQQGRAWVKKGAIWFRIDKQGKEIKNLLC